MTTKNDACLIIPFFVFGVKDILRMTHHGVNAVTSYIIV
jgi:hypothetical protein